MRATALRPSLAIVLLASTGLLLARGLSTDRAATARAFLDSLTPSQRASASIELDSEQRLDWHFIPRENEGLAIGELDEGQLDLLWTMMRSSVSERTMDKVEGIRALERILFERESRPDRPATHRDPDRYWIAVFGTPAKDAPWGWRLQGHHLSFNVSSVTGELVTHTPFFVGANPRVVEATDERARSELLSAEVEAARALLESLDAEQRAVALVKDARPQEVVLAPGREEGIGPPRGLPAQQLDAEQRALLDALLEQWIGHLEPELARAERERIASSNKGEIHFLWIGDPRPDQPQYYRVHGPHFVIEYATTGDDPNHAHAVWRDLENDFGGDLLRLHYERSHR